MTRGGDKSLSKFQPTDLSSCTVQMHVETEMLLHLGHVKEHSAHSGRHLT
jgi:hypothetical protein